MLRAKRWIFDFRFIGTYISVFLTQIAKQRKKKTNFSKYKCFPSTLKNQIGRGGATITSKLRINIQYTHVQCASTSSQSLLLEFKLLCNSGCEIFYIEFNQFFSRTLHRTPTA